MSPLSPLPKSGTYAPKVNGLYQYLDGKMGDGGKGMKQAFSRAFGIEIDHYALIGFTGVIKLIRNVGGVDVTLAEPYYDPYYWVNNHHRGWGLPAGKSHLDADDALIFARSRKGDSDFQRAKRQQQLVMAAVAKVRKRGLGELPKLLNIAKDTVRTDLPIDRAADLFALYSTVDLAKVDRAVFGPKKFAVRNGGTDYKLVLNLCKQWIANHFPPRGRWERGPRRLVGARRPARERRDRLLEGAGVDLVRDGAHPAHRGGAAALVTLVVRIRPGVERDARGAQVAERLADLAAQEQLGRALLLVAARVQVLVGLGHQPDRRPGRLRGHDRADPGEVLRAGA